MNTDTPQLRYLQAALAGVVYADHLRECAREYAEVGSLGQDQRCEVLVPVYLLEKYCRDFESEALADTAGG